ncbi:DUF389 domain-containing protein [Nocardioides panacisoli]|uniref:DUF389 domain-containing protein n=1 Tax=Nocardioides panacisoli TaxID=627624 RepID=UPI001C63130C|nr:DUF389 domain-containing protein [Nocardioides panacisoli]QYJ04832.1 DUF389 domain-containing protein [Nocardioides panacisoli]
MDLALRLEAGDVARITGTLYVGSRDPRRDLSGFWVLLVLAAVIAAAGIVADSTATVIGAMIVAPLMRPILGVACAMVLVDRRQLVRAVVLVLGGAALVVSVGFTIGLLTQADVVAASNGQVAGRVSPRLIDLVAALATGFVGAFALIRSDVSDSLPGVAIAISLVPPLAVVGLTLESGAGAESFGALLLFGTNVAAIIATGTLLLLVSDIRREVGRAGHPVGELRGRTLAAVGLSLALVSVPLGGGSVQVAREEFALRSAEPVVTAWAEDRGWSVTDTSVRGDTLHVEALGPRADPGLADLRSALDDAGLDDLALELEFLLGDTRRAP